MEQQPEPTETKSVLVSAGENLKSAVGSMGMSGIIKDIGNVSAMTVICAVMIYGIAIALPEMGRNFHEQLNAERKANREEVQSNREMYREEMQLNREMYDRHMEKFGTEFGREFGKEFGERFQKSIKPKQ